MSCGMVRRLCGVVLILTAVAGWAAPPAVIDYQGKILVNDIPLTGSGYFKYAISDEAGSTNYWAQDGTATGEPVAWVTNECYNGVFSAALGADPMGAMDPELFAVETSLVLRVWFSSDAVTFDEMLPAQPLQSSPYAINADKLDGYDAVDLLGGSITETDPVFTASAAFGITGTQIGNWNTAFGWGDHALAGYLTSYTETDPVWTAASNLYYLQTQADGRFVDAAGDTMTGALIINDSASGSLRIDSTNSTVAIGQLARGGVLGVAVGSGANAVDYGAVVGYQANGTQNGAVIGYNANGGTNGAAVGAAATAQNEGAAVGAAADGRTAGAAVGYQANGSSQGVAVGRDSAGFSYGAAVGPWAQGQWYGAALGRAANGATNGVAIGYAANGAYTNIAIGVAADAQLGTERIALGHNVTNDMDNTARIRGDFYMDGGDRVFGRRPFATGAFRQLLPLPPLENVVYVASNGTLTGSGAIDQPFNPPQAGYDFAAGKYTNEPATLVIASGTYPGLNMHAGNIHVIGESRAELDSLDITSGANFIRGKQRVENLIVAGLTAVVSDQGEDVKFHNCRFEGQLLIYGSKVEVQDCYASTGDGPAVIVCDSINNIYDVALEQSSFLAASPAQGTLQVNPGVEGLEVIGCKIVNLLPFAAIEDLQPIVPGMVPHLYSHNVIRGAEHGTSPVPAVYDPFGGPIPTLVFVHNAVWGDVGVNSNQQFFANNIVYGDINNKGGGIGWAQAGVGTGIDPAGNTEHQGNYPQFGVAGALGFPFAWQD